MSSSDPAHESAVIGEGELEQVPLDNQVPESYWQALRWYGISRISMARSQQFAPVS